LIDLFHFQIRVKTCTYSSLRTKAYTCILNLDREIINWDVNTLQNKHWLENSSKQIKKQKMRF
jgi:hypothetical protein